MADLYSRLFKAHREEIKEGRIDSDLDTWSLTWWKPILTCLESTDKLKKSYTYEVNIF